MAGLWSVWLMLATLFAPLPGLAMPHYECRFGMVRSGPVCPQCHRARDGAHSRTGTPCCRIAAASQTSGTTSPALTLSAPATSPLPAACVSGHARVTLHALASTARARPGPARSGVPDILRL